MAAAVALLSGLCEGLVPVRLPKFEGWGAVDDLRARGLHFVEAMCAQCEHTTTRCVEERSVLSQKTIVGEGLAAWMHAAHVRMVMRAQYKPHVAVITNSDRQSELERETLKEKQSRAALPQHSDPMLKLCTRPKHCMTANPGPWHTALTAFTPFLAPPTLASCRWAATTRSKGEHHRALCGVGPDRVHAGEATGLGLIGRHMEGAIDVARTLRATVVGQAPVRVRVRVRVQVPRPSPAVLRMLCSTLGELFCWVGAAGAVYGVQQLGILRVQQRTNKTPLSRAVLLKILTQTELIQTMRPGNWT
eukprot:1158221-Pelagomonas_calceolata.AAC.7